MRLTTTKFFPSGDVEHDSVEIELLEFINQSENEGWAVQELIPTRNGWIIIFEQEVLIDD